MSDHKTLRTEPSTNDVRDFAVNKAIERLISGQVSVKVARYRITNDSTKFHYGQGGGARFQIQFPA